MMQKMKQNPTKMKGQSGKGAAPMPGKGKGMPAGMPPGIARMKAASRGK